MDNTKYGKHIVTELKTPPFTKERMENYATWAKRVLWMDKNNVPGAFQMNCSWYCHPNPGSVETVAHKHETDEIIGFFSPDYEKPYDLGAEIEFWLEDEMHIITTSAMIFVPGGMKHCPLILRRVDRPIFHFTVVTGGEYKFTQS